MSPSLNAEESRAQSEVIFQISSANAYLPLIPRISIDCSSAITIFRSDISVLCLSLSRRELLNETSHLVVMLSEGERQNFETVGVGDMDQL